MPYIENVVGAWVRDKCYHKECLEDWDGIEAETLITQEEIDEDDGIYLCDACKKRIG